MVFMPTTEQTKLERWIQAACIAEASVPKPGNVHPGADFPDLRYEDFVRSAALASPFLAQAGTLGVGPAILEAIRATRQVVNTNTNLGICLLIAPLAAVPLEQDWREGVADVLSRTTLDDSIAVYWAIRCAEPGGMGQIDAQDVSEQPTLPLKEVMQLGAAGTRETLFHPRDSIARQYTENYWQVDLAVESFRRWTLRTSLENSIIGLHLSLLAAIPDTLIARKRGISTAIEAACRAAGVLSDGWPENPVSNRRLAEFDAWLRADGHQRNPGTTADLVAAVLFLALRERHVSVGELESLAVEVICEESE